MGGEIKQFRDLTAWQRSNRLAVKVYEITSSFPKEETYGLISQMRRAVVSIGANISEGFTRYYFADKMRF
ncbi:four helix bundle protein [Patescibacteria group bacterium]|nr:four helix bundle protein [Patescibacteria group bacterium]